jgi:hypothetical protein
MEAASVRLNEGPQEYCLTEVIALVVTHYLYLTVSGMLRGLGTERRCKLLVSCGPTLRPVSASCCLRVSAGCMNLELICGDYAVEKHTRPSEYSLLCTTSQGKERRLVRRAIRTSSCDLSLHNV